MAPRPDEVQRLHAGVAGSVPADQRLTPVDPPVVERRPSAGSGRRTRARTRRGAAPARSPAARAARAGAASSKTACRLAAALLRLEHRGVGVPDQLLARWPTARGDGDADAHRRRPDHVLDRQRPADRLPQPGGDGDRLGLVAEVLAQHGELVAAEPRRRVLRPDRRRHAAGELDEHRSPAAWPRVSLTSLKSSTSRNSTAASRSGCGGAGRGPARPGRGTAPGWAGRSARRAAPGAAARPRPGAGR